MNSRRSFLCSMLAGLLAPSMATAQSSEARTPDHRLVCIRPDESILNRRGVAQMGTADELEGGTITLSFDLGKEFAAYRQQLSQIGVEASSVRRPLRWKYAAHWREGT